MKPSRWIFLLIVVTVVFIGAAIHWLRPSREDSRIAIWRPAPTNAGVEVIPPPTVPSVVTVTNQFQWAQLESEDYHEYIARLRKIGCPEETIRDIIIADVDKLFAPRVAALRPNTNEPRYWRADD